MIYTKKCTPLFQALPFPGQAYHLGFYKPQGRPAYVSSLLVTPYIGGFTYALDFQRKPGEMRIYLEGPATDKKVNAAFQELIREMIAGGFIAQENAAENAAA